MSETTSRAKTFKINPVELVIFAAVFTAFAHSAYRLMYHWEDFRTAQVSQGSSEATREPASMMKQNSIAGKTYQSVTFSCSAAPTLPELNANKIRLTGMLCSHPNDARAGLKKTTVVNLANEAEATVFANQETGQFTTDYIDLIPGANVIAFRFEYDGQPPVDKELVVQRTQVATDTD